MDSASHEPADQQLVAPPKPGRPAHTPKYKRLTDQQRITILNLAKLGKTQVEIGQTIGCDQATVHRWLEKFEDTTEHATAFCRGRALSWAEKIDKKGKPDVLLKALQGVNVLQDERSAGATIIIGIKDSDVSVTLTPGSSPVKTLTGETL